MGDAASALRRRREARQPYAKLHDGDGAAVLLDPASPRAKALIEIAAGMVDAVAPPPPPSRDERSRRA
jgi:hypothetical protein